MANDKNEQKFLAALQELFVGAKIEGESGYVNLMRIKARYFTQGVLPQIRQDVTEAVRDFPAFREELFDKLYTFFSRYFSESGSIYFRYTTLHDRIYEKVYSADRDVALFWKTHMLYYVKTDRLFRSAQVTVDGVPFFFDATSMTLKRANEKRAVVFSFRERLPDGTLAFDVTYSEKGKATRIDDILKAAKKAGARLTEPTLTRALRVFEKQSEVDFFINKNARAFLREQFDLWLYQYLFTGNNVWTADRLAQLQALKTVAFNIIDFIAQFEDELVKIWLKPKFVRRSHYVLTLDKLTPALLERVLAHPAWPAQLQEWRDLALLEDDFDAARLTELDAVGEPRYPRLRFLPLDTRHFPDLELDILALFPNLDEALDGWLIHSENFQALNSLLPRFRERVQAVYIDPPYNTDASEIIYVNEYKDSSWISLMENRLSLSSQFLSPTGFHCVAIDDFELSRLRLVLEEIFPPENFVGTVVVRNNPAGRATAKGFSIAHEYLVFNSKTPSAEIGRLEHTEKQVQRYKEQDENGQFEWVNFRKHGGLNARREYRPKLFYPIFASISRNSLRVPKMLWDNDNLEWKALEHQQQDEIVVFPIAENGEERTWKWSHETLIENLDSLSVKIGSDGKAGIYMKSRLQPEGTLPRTIWTEARHSATDYGTNLLTNLFGEGQKFSFPKSVYAVEDALKVQGVSNDGDIVLDYFAGSGTTAHAVMNLNRADGGRRKYILVEMGEHFHTVMLPRLKKVAFCSQWKDGRPAWGKGVSGQSQFFKYYALEQYEEALRRARYRDGDLFTGYADAYHAYVFMRDEKMLDAMHIDEANDTLTFHPEQVYPDIDLAETLANLRGQRIKTITAEYVEFANGERHNLKNPDWRAFKPLVWW